MTVPLQGGEGDETSYWMVKSVYACQGFRREGEKRSTRTKLSCCREEGEPSWTMVRLSVAVGVNR